MFDADPIQAFSGQGQMKAEQLEIERLRREVTRLKGGARHIKKGRSFLREEDDMTQRVARGNEVHVHREARSMSRSGNCWENAAMESFFFSLKTERTAAKVYRTKDQAIADVFDTYRAARRS